MIHVEEQLDLAFSAETPQFKRINDVVIGPGSDVSKPVVPIRMSGGTSEPAAIPIPVCRNRVRPFITELTCRSVDLIFLFARLERAFESGRSSSLFIVLPGLKGAINMLPTTSNTGEYLEHELDHEQRDRVSPV